MRAECGTQLEEACPWPWVPLPEPAKEIVSLLLANTSDIEGGAEGDGEEQARGDRSARRSLREASTHTLQTKGLRLLC